MTTTARRLVFLGLAGAGAVAVWARRTGGVDRIPLRQTMPVRPDRVVALVSQVQREPEFIPPVLAVTVFETGPNWARYRVDFVGGIYALYRKSWEPGRIAWHSEGGTLGLQQRGVLRLVPMGGSTDVHLAVETSFDAPLLGPFAALGSRAFALPAFRAWLRNLSRHLAAQSLKGVL